VDEETIFASDTDRLVREVDDRENGDQRGVHDELLDGVRRDRDVPIRTGTVERVR
jgi:hypothetical protein